MSLLHSIKVPQFANARVQDEVVVQVTKTGIQLTIIQGLHGSKAAILLPIDKSSELVDALQRAQTYFVDDRTGD